MVTRQREDHEAGHQCAHHVPHGDLSRNLQLENGDTVYVQRAPVFYIYGEVQRAGFIDWSKR